MTDYSASSIKILKGLDAVRKRPAMYIGSTGKDGLHHLVYEIIDNSVDEALAGYCTQIKIVFHSDGSCSIEDNGRGIPTDIHPAEGISAAEVVFTKLHAGGKFDKDSYRFSGGLHGVGASVVNALSEWVEVKIFQNGKVFYQYFELGVPKEKLKVIDKTEKRGTFVRFKPDPEIFTETVDFDFDVLSTRFRELAFLNKGLRIEILDEKSNRSHNFFFEGGIASFVEHLSSKKNVLFSDVAYFEKHEKKFAFECAFQYNDGYGEHIFSFVNNINTMDGGTHVTGFKAALTKASNKRGHDLGILKENESFSSEDVREGLVTVINLKISDPQFEGQTKMKLGNSEVKGLVSSLMFSFFDNYFEENPAIARKILQKAQSALRAREAARKAREITRQKSIFESTVLPGKLADCSSAKAEESELYIVEGDSAGGSAKSARDRFTQAILPLRGKILNVEKARLDKILANTEIKALIAAVGANILDDFEIEKVRYHKIILMTDADVDGSHIRALLLTFFYRYMKPLVEKGYLYVAQPPLFRVKIGKKEQYIGNEYELKQFIINWIQENAQLVKEGKIAEREAFDELLKKVEKHDLLLERLAFKFKLSLEGCALLVGFLRANPDISISDPEKLLKSLKAYVSSWKVSLFYETEEKNEESADTPEKEEDQDPRKVYLQFKGDGPEWQVSLDFFMSSEFKDLLAITRELELLNNNWELKIAGKEFSIPGSSILEFTSSMSKLSKPYMSVQRYKGLGEMNPEQLWETSMDPKHRKMLRVSLGDAIEADMWFATLMGDDVSGRKQFIKENGQFVRNLDV